MSDQYHLSLKSISRKAGRSSTAAAAYRSGELIIDERTGEIHDYRRKRGVLYSQILLPGGGTMPRAALWNAVEIKHKRGDAILVREIEIALPSGLNAAQRKALVEKYARLLANRYKVAVDLAIHAPHPVTDADLERDPHQYYVEEIEVLDDGHEIKRRHNGNWHAHVSMSACHFDASGVPGKKCVELDQIHCQRAKIDNAADVERPRWAELANAALAAAGSADRIDHRSYAARGIDRVPTVHRGAHANAVERRTGQASRRRLYGQQLAAEAAQVEAGVEAEIAALISGIEAELADAVADRDAELAQAAGQAEDVPAVSQAVPPAPDVQPWRAALAAARAATAAVPEISQADAAAVEAPTVSLAVSAAPLVPVVDQTAQKKVRLAELRTAAAQAEARASSASMTESLLGYPRDALVELRRVLGDAQRERDELERRIQARGWIASAAALISDPEADRVAELGRQAQAIGLEITAVEATVPAADRAHSATLQAHQKARKAAAEVKTAELELKASEAAQSDLQRRQDVDAMTPNRQKPKG